MSNVYSFWGSACVCGGQRRLSVRAAFSTHKPCCGNSWSKIAIILVTQKFDVTWPYYCHWFAKIIFSECEMALLAISPHTFLGSSHVNYRISARSLWIKNQNKSTKWFSGHQHPLWRLMSHANNFFKYKRIVSAWESIRHTHTRAKGTGLLEIYSFRIGTLWCWRFQRRRTGTRQQPFFGTLVHCSRCVLCALIDMCIVWQ